MDQYHLVRDSETTVFSVFWSRVSDRSYSHTVMRKICKFRTILRFYILIVCALYCLCMYVCMQYVCGYVTRYMGKRNAAECDTSALRGIV